MAKSDLAENDDQALADQMQHLRELVVGRTNSSLEQLRQEVASKRVSAEEVSELLPQAIKRSAASGPGLAKAIGPTFSDAFQESVKRDPQALADAVSPIMGPAIQGYIQQQIQAMVQSLNTALDHSLSPKGMRWRIEAWKTGKPFAEVVLLHTLIYRIEQVMLIDPRTGMLMQSTSSRATDDDADLVSSLLTAIQDFMRDSFRHRSDSGSDLQEIQTNELTVWMQHGPAAIIAVAIRGEPPLSLRQKIRALLDRLHVQYRPLLDNFRGDTTPLELVKPDLEELLESEFVNKKEKQPKQTKNQNTDPLIAWWKQQLRWIVPTVLLLLLSGWGWNRQRENQRFANFITALRTQPGIVLTEADRAGHKLRVHGWRDPHSVDPDRLRAQSGLPADAVDHQWELIRSADPRIILRRLQASLPFENTVTVHCDQVTGKVFIGGAATADWIARLRDLSTEFHVESSLDLRQLTVTQEQALR